MVLPNFQPPSGPPHCDQFPPKTEITLSAWRNCAHEDAVSNFVSGYAFSKLVDDAHGLMADDQARFDGILASQNVEVRTANGREGYTYYSFARSRPRDGHCFQPDPTRSVKNQCFHRGGCFLPLCQ